VNTCTTCGKPAPDLHPEAKAEYCPSCLTEALEKDRRHSHIGCAYRPRVRSQHGLTQINGVIASYFSIRDDALFAALLLTKGIRVLLKRRAVEGSVDPALDLALQLEYCIAVLLGEEIDK
jgi:hypothetical protein